MAARWSREGVRGGGTHGSLRAGAALVTAALVLSGCRLAAAEPSSTPEDFPGITRVLWPMGIAVDAIVSGDAGCPDATLSPTAISFRASGLDQPEPIHLHLYRFKDDAKLQRNLPAVDLCASHYITDPERYVKIEASPYVVTAEGPMGEKVLRALPDGLREAAAPGS